MHHILGIIDKNASSLFAFNAKGHTIFRCTRVSHVFADAPRDEISLHFRAPSASHIPKNNFDKMVKLSGPGDFLFR
jgi:hypothetical protein